jgi:hypothetical protein
MKCLAIQRYNDNKSIVRDYTDSANVKDYVQNILVPKFFPRIPVSGLKVGEIGLISEFMSAMVEDGSYGTSIGMNETFITRAVLDESIYSSAATFDLGYNYAIPSACPVVLEINHEDIMKYAVDQQVYIDRDTKVLINGYEYVLDYDIRLTYTFIGGRIRFNAVYDMSTFNPVSTVTSPYIACRVTDRWVVLYITVRECKRTYEPKQITDNMLFTAANIYLPFSDMICGMSAYYTYNAEKRLMQNKVKYSIPLQSPFLYHRLKDENTIEVSFASGKNNWRPAFNSKIDFTIYTCNGDKANFYITSDMEVTVMRTGERFIYNEDLRIVAIPYNGSLGGNDQPDIEMVRWDTIEAFNTAHVLMTDDDISLYFENYSRRYNTVAKFFKRRDDPTGRLFGMFNLINKDGYIYETLTAKAHITLGAGQVISAETDPLTDKPTPCETGTYTVNKMTTTIYSGDLWRYRDDSNDEMVTHTTLVMLEDPDTNKGMNIGKPHIAPADPTKVFVNPFIMKINKYPGLVSYYNPLVNYNGIMKQDFYEEATLDHFIVTRIELYRGIGENEYRVRVILVPSTQESEYNDYDPNRNFKYNYFSDANSTYRFSFAEAGINMENVNLNNGQLEILPEKLELTEDLQVGFTVSLSDGTVFAPWVLIGSGTVFPAGSDNPYYRRSISEYLQDQYGIFPKDGCTVFDTDILAPDENGFEGKYVYNTFREFISVTPKMFPLRVVLSSETTVETNYTEMVCVANEHDTYVFETYIKTQNDIMVVQGHEVLCILLGNNPYDTKNVPKTTPTAPDGTTFVMTSDTKMHVYTLFKGPLANEIVIDPKKDKAVDFATSNAVNEGTPPILTHTVFNSAGQNVTPQIMNTRFDAIVRHMQTMEGYSKDDFSASFFITDSDTLDADGQNPTTRYRWKSAPDITTMHWDELNLSEIASSSPNDGYDFSFSFSHPPAIYNNDPIIFSNNISAAYMNIQNPITGAYDYPIADKSTIINKNDGSTYQYLASSNRWLLLGSPPLFANPDFRGWNMTDAFINDWNDFDLLELWPQMRSTVIFNGSISKYMVDIGLVPFLRYDLCKDPEKVSFVIRAMVAQYKAMAQLVSDRLEENTGIDFKLFNTCGRGVFYKIGVDESDISSWSRIKSVSLTIKFVMGVHEEILFQDTMDAVKDHIKAYIETLKIDEATIFSVSNLQTSIETNIPNVRYLIFLGINEYDSTYQRIKLDDPYKVDMTTLEMQVYVPEKLTINRQNIIIIHGE